MLSHSIARLAPLFLAGLTLLGMGVSQCEPASPTPIIPEKPSVSFILPPNNATLFLNEPAQVQAVARDSSGIKRVDLVLDGVIIHTQPLVFATVEFNYQYTWRPAVLGVHTLTLLAYNGMNAVSDPVTIRVNVVTAPASPTPVPPPATITPFVVVVTATRPASPTPTWTPRVVVVTQTRNPSPSRSATPTASQTPAVIVVTNTPPPSPTGTQTRK